VSERTDAQRAAALLGEQAARARREVGLSQRQLADLLGTSLWSVSRFERGDGSPPADIPAIAQALGRPGLAHDPNVIRAARLLGTGDGADGGAQAAAADRELGERVALARREAGLSQGQLAASLGTSIWGVRQLESGADGSVADIPAIARATNKPVSWFRPGATRPPGRDDVSAAAHGQDTPRIRGRRWARTVPEVLGPEARRNLVLASLALLVTIRFFTEVIVILPRAANFVDVPIVAVLAVAAALHPEARPPTVRKPRFLLLGLAFLGLSGLSMLVNLSRIDVGPVLVFVYGFLAPLVIYWAVHSLWPSGQALSISRLLIALGLVQLAVVAGIQLPTFLETKNPDDVSGTFGENGYQLVFLLLVVSGLLAGIYTFERQRLAAKFAPLFVAAMMAVVFLAQYRSLLLATAVTILAVALLLGSLRGRGVLAGVFVAAAAALTLSYVAEEFPELRFAPTIDTLTADPGYYLSQRGVIAEDVLNLFSDDPRFIATGTGPGTYSSRAWSTFVLAESESSSNVAGDYVLDLTGGEVYSTDVSDKYVLPRLRSPVTIEGSKSVKEPFASYLALLAEVGVVGFLLIAAIYVGALAYAGRMTIAAALRGRLRDPLPAVLLAATVSFLVLLQLAFLGNWLEVTRVTFLAWALLAVGAKEFEARDGAPEP
jgi:transcriptional regulator with XRE-family HTH domain